MEISRIDPADGYAIKSYARGCVVINQTEHRQNLILLPNRVLANWRPQHFDELMDTDFEELVALDPEIIILGTGATQRFPSPALYVSILEKAIGFEIMDTAAACRTYNILMSEGRQVAAALILIE